MGIKNNQHQLLQSMMCSHSLMESSSMSMRKKMTYQMLEQLKKSPAKDLMPAWRLLLNRHRQAAKTMLWYAVLTELGFRHSARQ